LIELFGNNCRTWVTDPNPPNLLVVMDRCKVMDQPFHAGQSET
jgi:hypothetical protein